MLTPLTYGNTHSFLLRGTSNILVDTDYAGTLSAFYKAIKECGVKTSDIDYLLCTHFHPDHCGLAGLLTEQGIRLILMESQIISVHFSDSIFAREKHTDYIPVDEKKAQILTFAGSRAFLKSLGIDGEIIPTPSHSEDSISVVLDDGTCIVGDLEPYEYLEAYSDNAALKADWDRILSFEPQQILYAHAK